MGATDRPIVVVLSEEKNFHDKNTFPKKGELNGISMISPMVSHSSPISDFDNFFLFSAGSVMWVIAVVSFIVTVVSILVTDEGDGNVRLVTGLLLGLVLCLGSRVTNVLTVVGNIEVDVALTSME